MANKFIREPSGDGGSPRIPTLKVRNQEGREILITDNEGKARTFAKMFFPPPPPTLEDHEHFQYPEPLPDPPQISASQIRRLILKLSPHKAPGPDGIPNIVLQKCVDLLLRRLICIYRAILELDVYYDPWKESTTVVLRKPGKPSYEVPKAHRPIVLISTLAKVLTAIVAENLSKTIERHHLLPKTHFGGRPGRSTADAVHYLVEKVCTAWRNKRVVSVLFLDVEGAFPNAVERAEGADEGPERSQARTKQRKPSQKVMWSIYNTNIYLRRCHVINHVIWLEKWVETHYSMCPPLNMATSTSPKNVEQSKRSKRKNM